MVNIPIVTFDTSAHNRLVKDGARSEALLAGIKSGLFFRFAALSIEELIATPDPKLRAALFSSCAQLQRGPNDCLYPQNELIRLLTVAHLKNPTNFDWKLTTVQGQELKTRKTDYKEMFCKPRVQIQEVFKNYKEAPPATLREAIARLQSGNGALIWNIGKWLYDRGAETDASEARVRQFMDACPPFRALIYAMLMSWYNFAVRDPNVGERFNAGAVDQYMSIYLPYCDKFVTADSEQEKCLREIASLASVEIEVLSYDAFCNSFLVTV